MRRVFAAVAILTMVWSSAGAGRAQSPLSAAEVAVFQGTWVLDLVGSGLTDAEAERRVITTGPTSMRVDVYRAKDVRPFQLIYNLDGSPTTTSFGAGTAVSQLRREGPGLLAQTVYTVKNEPVTVHELLPSHPDGTELTIEVMVRVEHGYQGVRPPLEQAAPNTSKGRKVFQKQP